MLNKTFFKFTAGFLGILLLGFVGIVVVGYMDSQVNSEQARVENIAAPE